jgi:tetratricopeptide (TPR) repeat protein
MPTQQNLMAWQRAERLLSGRDFEDARQQYLPLLADQELRPLARQRLSLVSGAQGRYREAVDEALAAFEARQPEPELLELIAKRLFSLGELQAAIACATDPAMLRTRSISTLAELGKLLSDHGFPGDALQLLRRARGLGLNTPMLGYLIGLCLMYAGQAEEAEFEFKDCLRMEPGMPLALWALGKLRLRHGGEDRLRQLHDSIQRRGDADPETPLLYYTLFSELDRLDQVEPAWEALEQGMRLRWKQMHYDPDEEQELFAHLGSVRAPAATGEGQDGPRPVFIIGMPRSGTTLLERILGSHPDVADAGELTDLVRQLRWMCDLPGQSKLDLALARRAEDIDFAELGRRYLAHTQWRAQGKPVYTDKMPPNFLNVSYIARALPQARILHMVRGPMDTCFSNLKEWFAGAYPHSYDQVEMADHFARYRGLMAHWRAQYPELILDVRYDELVTDPEKVLREVLGFCGLPWHEGMAAIEKRAGTVNTASAAQVREPIHQRFLDQWRRYADHLGPLKQRLGALAY